MNRLNPPFLKSIPPILFLVNFRETRLRQSTFNPNALERLLFYE